MSKSPPVVVCRWPIALPLDTLEVGPALTEEQRSIEASIGVTTEILHAYARALPDLMGESLRHAVYPLSFGRGSLVAVATDVPVDIRGLRFVQTSSPEVCRQLGERVPLFHVDNEACLAALIEAGSAVERVWVNRRFDVESDAPFEVIFDKPTYDNPEWVRRTAPDELALMGCVCENQMFAWDRDFGKEVVYDYDRCVTFDATDAELDVVPHDNPPPWAPLEAWTIRGHGWAATSFVRPVRDLDCVRAVGRRWLLFHAFPDGAWVQELLDTWEAGDDISVEGEHTTPLATACEVELLEGKAKVRWTGRHRVLRVRDGAIEQLTTDFTLANEPDFVENVPPERREELERYSNVVTRTLHSHGFDHLEVDCQPGDRFVLVSAVVHDLLELGFGTNLPSALAEGTPKDVARRMATLLMGSGGLRPVVIVDHDAHVDRADWVSAAPPNEDLLTGRVRGATVEERAASVGDDPIAVEWLRTSKHPSSSIHKSLSRHLSESLQSALLPDNHVFEVSSRELIDHPTRYHGRHVRARGVLSLALERSAFAGAWFDGPHDLDPGIWLVEATGLWSSDPEKGYGHFGMSKSRLQGLVRVLPTEAPRAVPADRVRFARPYVALTTRATVHRGLHGWRIDGHYLKEMVGCPRFTRTEVPDSSLVRLDFVRDGFGAIGVFAWEIVGESTPLVPREVALWTDFGATGEYVEVVGMLTSDPGDRWPQLDEKIRIVPPPVSLTGDRYALPQAEMREKIADVVGTGMVVRVTGEVYRSRSGVTLFATRIVGPHGPLKLDPELH